MSPEAKKKADEAAVRALVSRINKAIKGRRVDHIGAALATVVGEICISMGKTRESMIGGVDALAGDAKLHIMMRTMDTTTKPN